MDVVVAHLRIENRKFKQKDAKNTKKRERLSPLNGGRLTEDG
jgi:hypothetical protein